MNSINRMLFDEINHNLSFVGELKSNRNDAAKMNNANTVDILQIRIYCKIHFFSYIFVIDLAK